MPRSIPPPPAVYVIDPANPPLPTAMNLPFHVAAGNHTSILMSEPAAGLSVAATRQNGGRSIRLAFGVPVTPGGTNVPATVTRAMVTVVYGSVSEPRRLQASEVIV